jgi:hypothetical protein
LMFSPADLLEATDAAIVKAMQGAEPHAAH